MTCLLFFQIPWVVGVVFKMQIPVLWPTPPILEPQRGSGIACLASAVVGAGPVSNLQGSGWPPLLLVRWLMS